MSNTKTVNIEAAPKVEIVKKEITIIPKQYTRKKDEHKFYGYKAVDKQGNLMDAAFTKAALEGVTLPTEKFVITVDASKINIDRFSNVRPKLWIKEIIHVVAFESVQSDTAKKDIEDTF